MRRHKTSRRKSVGMWMFVKRLELLLNMMELDNHDYMTTIPQTYQGFQQ